MKPYTGFRAVQKAIAAAPAAPAPAPSKRGLPGAKTAAPKRSK